MKIILACVVGMALLFPVLFLTGCGNSSGVRDGTYTLRTIGINTPIFDRDFPMGFDLVEFLESEEFETLAREIFAELEDLLEGMDIDFDYFFNLAMDELVPILGDLMEDIHELVGMFSLGINGNRLTLNGVMPLLLDADLPDMVLNLINSFLNSLTYDLDDNNHVHIMQGIPGRERPLVPALIDLIQNPLISGMIPSDEGFDLGAILGLVDFIEASIVYSRPTNTISVAVGIDLFEILSEVLDMLPDFDIELPEFDLTGTFPISLSLNFQRV